MTEKLSLVLLVDDYEADTYLHRLVFESLGCAEQIDSRPNGREALSYLRELQERGDPLPELILLDINMPVMDGWEFLEAFKELEPRLTPAPVVLMMLTTSARDEDRERASASGVVADYLEKPLTEDCLQGVLREHFADRFGG